MRKALLLLCSLLALSAAARTLTPDQALARARGEARQKAPALGWATSLSLAYTAGDAAAPGLYVFNSSAGFLVVSADDAVTPLLGYSDAGALDVAEMPENLRWWLGEYGRQIARAGAEAPAPRRAASYANIEPLVTALWDQDDPYNLLCPVKGGTRTVTGCAATAMAQIMYCHRWPLQGTGSNTYSLSSLGTLSMDFSQVCFDWDAMTPAYGSSSTEAGRQAVAQLMYACGIAVNMSYDTAANGGSGASDTNVAKAFGKYFGYDKSTLRYVTRDLYSAAQWDDMVYAELIASRPVLYCGVSASGGGHAFVCDGYKDGYFHINWGWSGSSNGYFLLTALDPYTQGIGGSTGAFNFDQSIITGIKPATGPTQTVAELCVNGVFQTQKKSYNKLSEAVSFMALADNGSQALIYNSCTDNITFDLGVKLTPESGEPIYLSAGTVQDLPMGYGITTFSLSFSTVNPGSYVVTPAFYDRVRDVWKPVTQPYYSGKLTADVTDTSVNFTLEDGHPELTAAFTLDTPVVYDRNFKGTLTLSCMTDYTVTVQARVYSADGTSTLVGIGASQLVRVRGAQPVAVEYISPLYQLSGQALTPGTQYMMALMDEAGNILGEPAAFTLQANPGSTSVQAISLKLVSGSTAPADDIHLRGSVKCTSGYLSNALTICMYDGDPGNYGKYVTRFSTPMLFAQAGETVDFEMHASCLEGAVDHPYLMTMVIGGEIIYSTLVSFTLTEPSPTAQNVLTFSAIPLTDSTPVNVVAKDADGNWHARAVELYDGIEYHNPTDLQAGTISYIRTFGHTDWAALYIPFSLTPEEWTPWAATVLEFDGDTTVDGETVLTYRRVADTDDIEANHPYVFMPVASGLQTLTVHDKTLHATPSCPTRVPGSDYSLYGIYDTKTDMASSRSYALQGGAFRRATSDAVTLRPFRVYIMAESLRAVQQSVTSLSMVIGGDTTGIGAIGDEPHADGILYDLSGRRVTDPVPGIYILDGHKILIK